MQERERERDSRCRNNIAYKSSPLYKEHGRQSSSLFALNNNRNGRLIELKKVVRDEAWRQLPRVTNFATRDPVNQTNNTRDATTAPSVRYCCACL